MPFLFVWTAMFTIPLIMSTGVIGLVQYLGFLTPRHVVGLVIACSCRWRVVALVVFALYRRVTEAAAISTVLWVVAMLSLLIVIVASLTNFDAHLAFTYPHHAFAFGGPFWAGLGGGLLIGDLRLPRLQHDRLHGRRDSRTPAACSRARSSTP